MCINLFQKMFYLRLGILYQGRENHPPGCVQQCPTMFTQCPTHLGLLGLPMAKNDIFGSKKVIFGHLWGPPVTFSGGPKGSNSPPPDVSNNVQPCSPNVQPIWGCS